MNTYMALPRSAKYRPQFRAKGSADLDQACGWASSFVRWYIHDHRYSGVGYVSPAQRHTGKDRAVLQVRYAFHRRTEAENPQRSAGHTRNGNPITVIALNPERDAVINAAAENFHNSKSTARNGR